MKHILLTTAMVACMVGVAHADNTVDGASLGGTLSSSSGASFSGVGNASEGTIGVNGFGQGKVVVASSELTISLNPGSENYSNGELQALALTHGDINVDSTRKVSVDGGLIGQGQVAGAGSTVTTFDASLLSSARATNTLNVPTTDGTEVFQNTVDQNYSVSGLANLSGVSGSSAGFNLTGATADFLGKTGTEVTGGFNAKAHYFEVASLADYTDPEYASLAYDGMFGDDYGALGTSTSVTIDKTDIKLPVMSNGGGTVELTGASADLFSGSVLGSSDSEVLIDLNDPGLAGSSLCGMSDALDTVLGTCSS